MELKDWSRNMKKALIGGIIAATAAIAALPSAASARTYSSFSLSIGNGPGYYDPYYDGGYYDYGEPVYGGYSYYAPSYYYSPRYRWRDHDRWEHPRRRGRGWDNDGDRRE